MIHLLPTPSLLILHSLKAQILTTATMMMKENRQQEEKKDRKDRNLSLLGPHCAKVGLYEIGGRRLACGRTDPMNLALLALTSRMSTRFMTTAPSKGFVIFQATEECAVFAELPSVNDNENAINRHHSTWSC
jgi:hypothetical protein